jgi:hypothetical protein
MFSVDEMRWQTSLLSLVKVGQHYRRESSCKNSTSSTSVMGLYNKQDDLVVAVFTCLYALLLLVTCIGIFIIIETIDLKVKYIYIKNRHCIGRPQQHAGHSPIT